MELLPKPAFNKAHIALTFYEEFLDDICVEVVATTPQLVKQAEAEARRVGLTAADALHVAAAKSVAVDEFVTAEKTTKPLFRIHGLRVVSIRQ